MDKNAKSEKTKSFSFFNHLVVPIATALVVGGTAPWWVEFIKGNDSVGSRESAVSTNSSEEAQNSEAIDNTSSINIQNPDSVASDSSKVAKDNSTVTDENSTVVSDNSNVIDDNSAVASGNSTVTGDNATIASEQSVVQQSYGSGSNISAGGDVSYNEAPDSLETVQDSIALTLKKGMTYEEGRKILIDKGWQPIFPSSLGDLPNLDYPTIKYIFEDRGYQEVVDCSGTGLGFCLFRFSNGVDKQLSVTTVNNQPGDEIIVWSWSFN
ncbi:MAG: hypothetical protein AAFY20_13270 [Cyanobacteria bacterium J06639_14]